MIGFRPAVLVCAAILAGGCASAPKPAADDRLTPPKLLSSPRPELRFSRSQGRPVDVQVEVQIDPNGRPSIETLRVTGVGGAENRDAIATWGLRHEYVGTEHILLGILGGAKELQRRFSGIWVSALTDSSEDRGNGQRGQD